MQEKTRIEGPWQFGVISKSGGQGKRSDLLNLRDAIKSGKRGRDLLDDDLLAPTALQYTKAVDVCIATYATPMPRDNIRVVFHYGPAGTGKTMCCHSDEAYYFDGNQSGFWLGYKGETKVILDEFSGSTCAPLFFQRLCDRYPLWINVKGGQVPCMAVDVHITSNFLPSQWWSEKTKYNREAVYRRIHEVHYHRALNDNVVLVSDVNGYAMDKLAPYLYVPIGGH